MLDVTTRKNNADIDVRAHRQAAVQWRRSMNILIVDDYALFRHGLSLTLPELFEGSFITQAGSADEAIELLAGDTVFDLALVDLVMPGMNGLEGIKPGPEETTRSIR